MLHSIEHNIRLSLFALSGYSISTLDKYDFEPDIHVVKNDLTQRAFCSCCGKEVSDFDTSIEGPMNHNHICDRFEQIHD